MLETNISIERVNELQNRITALRQKALDITQKISERQVKELKGEFPLSVQEILAEKDLLVSKMIKMKIFLRMKKLKRNVNIEDIDILMKGGKIEKKEKSLTTYMNNIHNTDLQWKHKKTKNKDIFISHDGCFCLKQNDSKCENSNYIISDNKITAYCPFHGQKKQNKKKFKELFNILGITLNVKHRKINISGCDYDPDMIEYVYNNPSCTHEDVSYIFKCLYGDVLVCVSEGPRPVWYHYKDGLWSDTKGISKLKRFLVSGVAKFYTYAQDVMAKFGEADVDTYSQYRFIFEKEIKYCNYEKMTEIYNILNKLLDSLKTGGYCNTLLNHCIHHFKKDKFIENLDHNKHLLCFGEDVYNLKDCKWRKTRSIDMCSKKCGVSKDEVNNKEIKKVNKILNDIFSINEEKDYILNVLSYLLHGGNNDSMFQIWQGTGANGKGLLAVLLKYIFGDYYAESNISLLTQKSAASNAASPELARLQGIRIAMFSEPEKGAKLNNGLIKKITGGEQITARKLYCDNIEYMPQFTPIIQCNTNFSLEDITDDSIPRRLKFIEFKNQFVDQEDIKLEQHKLKDLRLKEDETLNKLKGSFMFIVLSRWEQLSRKYNSHIHPFKMPMNMKKTQNEFLNDNNLVKLFVKENINIIQKTEQKEFKYIQLKNLIRAYKNWFYEREGKKCKIKRATFQKRIRKYLPGLFCNRYQKNGLDIVSIYINCELIDQDSDNEEY